LIDQWQALYAESRTVPAVVTSCHLVALLFGGGVAVATDQAVLRVGRWDGTGRRRAVVEARALRCQVVAAVGALTLSGAALAAGRPGTSLTSPLFALKVLLLLLLIANSLVCSRIEETLRALARATPAEQGDRWVEEQQLWEGYRLAACVSLVLWSATTIVGAVLSITR
jgi:hypothetical protein